MIKHKNSEPKKPKEIDKSKKKENYNDLAFISRSLKNFVIFLFCLPYPFCSLLSASFCKLCFLVVQHDSSKMNYKIKGKGGAGEFS
jgi:hypothetical protein